MNDQLCLHRVLFSTWFNLSGVLWDLRSLPDPTAGPNCHITHMIHMIHKCTDKLTEWLVLRRSQKGPEWLGSSLPSRLTKEGKADLLADLFHLAGYRWLCSWSKELADASRHACRHFRDVKHCIWSGSWISMLVSFTVFHSLKILCFVSICFVSFLKLSLDISFCCASRPDCFVFKLEKSLYLGPTHRAKTFVTDKEIWDTPCHVAMSPHCHWKFILILRLLLAVPQHSGVRAFPGYKFTEGKLVMNLCAGWAVAEQKQQLRHFALQMC